MLDVYDQRFVHEKAEDTTDVDHDTARRELDLYFLPTTDSEWARLQMRTLFPALGKYAEHIDLLLSDVELATLWRAILYRMQRAAKVKQP